MRAIAVVLALVLGSVAPGWGATTRPARAGLAYVLLVSGQPGSPVYARRFSDWAARFHAYAVGRAGIPKANVVVLCGDKDLKLPIINGPATAESVVKAIGEMSQRLGPQDQVVLVLIGHGSLSNSRPQFVLPGPDLDPESLGKALSAIAAENQVVLNFSGSSGDFVKALARPGRVNIAATQGEEAAEPVYCEFFLRGLETGNAAPAGGANDRAITLLEAYNWACLQTGQWISRQREDEDHNWIVQGKGSVALFKKLFGGGEDDVGARKLSPESDATGDDPTVELASPKDAETARTWSGRRVINEHAVLEDAGKESGVSALSNARGYEPISAAKPGEAGHLAARVVLGQPALREGEKRP